MNRELAAEEHRLQRTRDRKAMVALALWAAGCFLLYAAWQAVESFPKPLGDLVGTAVYLITFFYVFAFWPILIAVDKLFGPTEPSHFVHHHGRGLGHGHGILHQGPGGVPAPGPGGSPQNGPGGSPQQSHGGTPQQSHDASGQGHGLPAHGHGILHQDPGGVPAPGMGDPAAEPAQDGGSPTRAPGSPTASARDEAGATSSSAAGR